MEDDEGGGVGGALIFHKMYNKRNYEVDKKILLQNAVKYLVNCGGPIFSPSILSDTYCNTRFVKT